MPCLVATDLSAITRPPGRLPFRISLLAALVSFFDGGVMRSLMPFAILTLPKRAAVVESNSRWRAFAVVSYSKCDAGYGMLVGWRCPEGGVTQVLLCFFSCSALQ
jgi:hypothetical protein